MNCISQVVKFSPNGQLLAIGSRDNNIYMYQVVDDYRRYNRMGRCVVRFNLASFNKTRNIYFYCWLPGTFEFRYAHGLGHRQYLLTDEFRRLRIALL